MSTKPKKAQATPPQEGVETLLDAALGLAPMPRIGADPPKEIRVFRWGPNLTTKGVLKLTESGAKRIMDAHRARGVVKSFDYFHATYDPNATGEAKKAAGQFRPEIRPDGLYFADIQWTPKASQGIRDGEWPYVSPAVLHDKDGEIFDIKNAGLVTDPGTIGAQPLILSAQELLMSDDPKNRSALEAYSTCSRLMAHLSALADTDGPHKDMANKAMGHIVPLKSLLEATIGPDILEAAARHIAEHESGERMLSALAEVVGEPEIDKLAGIVLAKVTAPPPVPPPTPKIEGVLLSDADASSAKTMLLDACRDKYPPARRSLLEQQSLSSVMSFLATADPVVVLSNEPVKEVPPVPPTSKNLETAIMSTEKPAQANESPAKPTCLSDLSPEMRRRAEIGLQGQRDLAKMMKTPFDEGEATAEILTVLSDYEPPKGGEIRPQHLPVHSLLTESM